MSAKKRKADLSLNVNQSSPKSPLERMRSPLLVPQSPSACRPISLEPRDSFTDVYPKGLALSEDTFTILQNKSAKRRAVTFDEVTLSDQPVEFHPNDVQLSSFITRKIKLKGCGIMSAAMDTVTEKELALSMAQMGGIGILHRNLDPEEQAAQLKWVRRKIHYGGMIDKPITFSPDERYSTFQKQVADNQYPFTSFPVVDDNKKMLGLLTRDQFEFIQDTNPTLREIMMDISSLVTAPENTNTEQAYTIMATNKVKKLPVLSSEGTLLGLYVWNDVKNDQRKREKFSLDKDGHYLVGAAIGVGPSELHRAELLVNNGCKVLVMDSSHGSCKPVRDQVCAVKKKFGNAVEIIAGNIASYASAKYLLDGEGKPDALKVGIGPGSICTTRQVTGHGIPQVTAIFEVWRAVKEHGDRTGYYVPIIADGGIRNSGDIVKAIAAGATGIMLGSMLAGCQESPGQLVIKDGRKYKIIRGMGSRSAMESRSGSRGRYYRGDKSHATEGLTKAQAQKMVPEGVEGLVQFKGTVEKVMLQLLGGVQAGLAHSGSICVPDFQAHSKIWMQSFAGVAEGKPHDISDIRH